MVLYSQVLEVSQLKEVLVALEKSISVEERKLDAVMGVAMAGSQRSHHLVTKELQDTQRGV